jgi:hypothetical protein
MKLIKDLGVSGKNRRGIFYCPRCHQSSIKRYSAGLIAETCGCKKRERKHPMIGRKIYGVWESMRQRCRCVKHKAYKNYGGRGITICDEWDKFETFYNWAMENGYSDGLQIDRINNDGDYCPSNCRFTTAKVNMRNTRNVKLSIKKAEEIREIFNKENKTCKEISELYDVNRRTIQDVVSNKSWV